MEAGALINTAQEHQRFHGPLPEMAQGTAASGCVGKCTLASTAPRALFCMPTCRCWRGVQSRSAHLYWLDKEVAPSPHVTASKTRCIRHCCPQHAATPATTHLDAVGARGTLRDANRAAQGIAEEEAACKQGMGDRWQGGRFGSDADAQRSQLVKPAVTQQATRAPLATAQACCPASPACSRKMAASSLGPAWTTAAAFWATTLPQMRAMSTTADSALKGASTSTWSGHGDGKAVQLVGQQIANPIAQQATCTSPAASWLCSKTF